MEDSNINFRVQTIIKKFKKFESWEERYKAIISFGKEIPSMDESLKTDINKVKGCQSQVWLVAQLTSDKKNPDKKSPDKKMQLQADSDASIVKGIVAMLVYIYSGATPNEILTTPTTFIDEIGLRQHLSQSRANGLNSMLKQILLFAHVFKTQILVKD